MVINMNDFITLVESKINDSKGLEFVEQQIQLLFTGIRQTKNLNEAEMLFKNLEDIQFVLAKAVFKNGLSVSLFLREFIYDYDRIDDEEVKQRLYQKITLLT